MRQLLAIIFLTVFTTQVLPLKAIGKLLSSGQNSEEVHHGADGDVPDGKALKFDDDLACTHHSFDLMANSRAFNSKVIAFIHRAECLPSIHIAEMLAPPPDIS